MSDCQWAAFYVKIGVSISLFPLLYNAGNIISGTLGKPIVESAPEDFPGALSSQ